MISVFTPSHKPAYLDEVLGSLQAQTVLGWEWIVLLNNGAVWCCDDPRVKVMRDDTKVANVGYLKRTACSHATGDVLLELDHDDLLFPTALEEVTAAFAADPAAVFVYSNTACHDVRTDKPITWSSRFGWSDRPCTFRGKEFRESVSADPYPQSISRIWFAPNHLRAWRRDAYWAIGGHNGAMKISDDHEMMMRTWLHGRMVHIDKPLYLYRVDGNNTWLANQNEIQTTMWGVHDRYIGAMAEKWARENGLRTMDLCSGPRPPAGYEGVDLLYGPVTADLNDRWPMEDGSVGVLRAVDAVEHLRDPIHTMNEAYRVLAHGGFLFVAVPSTNGLGAWADPTHVSFWNAMSFDYYTHPKMRAFIEPAATCMFQAIKVVDGTITSVTGRVLPYTFAHLVALKAKSPRFYGENHWEGGGQ
jgi:SAM-dependent methyltransferase